MTFFVSPALRLCLLVSERRSCHVLASKAGAEAMKAAAAGSLLWSLLSLGLLGSSGALLCKCFMTQHYYTVKSKEAASSYLPKLLIHLPHCVSFVPGQKVVPLLTLSFCDTVRSPPALIPRLFTPNNWRNDGASSVPPTLLVSYVASTFTLFFSEQYFCINYHVADFLV